MLNDQKILVVQTAFPGDIILTTPLFKAIKRLFPNSKLSVLTTPAGAELLKGIVEIDSLIPYDKRGRHKSIVEYVKLIARLRSRHYDLWISPHRSARTAIMTYFASPVDSVGFVDAVFSFCYRKKVIRDTSLHEVDRILSLLKPFLKNMTIHEKQPYLEISPQASLEAERILGENGITPRDLVIGMAPGSVWPTKQWTPEGFASLIDKLYKKYKAKILLLGSPNESECRDRILSLTENKPVDLIGKTTLSVLTPIVDRCRIFIGNDSAPGHVASARGVPVVSIFGPTIPAFGYAPYGEKVYIVEKELPCRPCHIHGPVKCPEGHFNCMKQISADDVMQGVKYLLEI